MRLDQQMLGSPSLREKGYVLPDYDVAALRARTLESPRWLHFGAGNLFRAMIAAGADTAIAGGALDTGLIACAGSQTVADVYAPYDNLCVSVVLGADGSVKKQVVGCIAAAIGTDDRQRLRALFRQPCLQLCSFTITEKGYHPAGEMMALLADLMRTRHESGGAPIALVSMDNCARNGDVLKRSLIEAAQNASDADFIAYLNDGAKVSFPWTMIDKITPRPDPAVAKMLADDGLSGMDIQITPRGAHIAPFVNAERVGYLVIEDDFPNGKPDLAACGFLLSSRETVAKSERMKVCTCLNPLHTALAIFGCLLGYTRIHEEMNDADLVALLNRLGYGESMPYVTNPGIIDPEAFLRTVIEERFPNPFMPDAPQRIAADTSQKLSIRFGETVKAHVSGGGASDLCAIPLVFAAWIRYLTGIDDGGNLFERSPDPMLQSLQPIADHLRHVGADFDESTVAPLLRNADIFGVDLYESGLAPRVIADLRAMLGGNGAVRSLLHQTISQQ